MRSRSAARATSLPICPRPPRWWTRKRSAPETPTSSWRPPRRAKAQPGSRTGNASAALRLCGRAAWWRSRIRGSAAWAPASSTPPRICAGRSRGSVAEVIELQRHLELRAAQQRDGGLQLVTLLTADAHLVALQARLHLELRVLDQALDLLARFRIDALPEQHLLARRGQRRVRILHLEAQKIDAALGKPQLQDLQHLLELKIHLRLQGDGEILLLEARPGVLEVKTLRQLAVRLVDRVGDLMSVQFGDDIERGHGGPSGA